MCSHVMRAGLLVGLTGLLVACSGEVDQVDTFELEGQTGTLSLTDAKLLVIDGEGEGLGATTSDGVAHFEANVPMDVELPIKVIASGGSDLITGRAAEFDMSALAFSSLDQKLHVSPISTLVGKLLECSGDVSAEMLEPAVELFRNRLSMGLDPEIDALHEALNADNAAALVLANAALMETLRRTEQALAASSSPLSAGDVLAEVACDLGADGQIDAVGGGASARALATFRAAEAAVLIEVLSKRLQIDGADGNGLMDAALGTVFGNSMPVASVAPNEALLAQAESALLNYLSHFDDEVLVSLALAAQGDPETASALAAELLDSRGELVLAGLAERVALADQSTIDALTTRMANQAAASAPTISLAASASTVSEGESVTLSWAVGDADVCLASGGWDGERPLQGTFQTAALSGGTSFVLECAGVGGTSRRVAQVVVDDLSPPVTTTLTALPMSVAHGDSAMLSWSSENAIDCTADLGWSGSRATSGSEPTGPLNSPRTYRLTCQGDGGSDVAAVTVQVGAPPSPVPIITFAADPSAVVAGNPTTLTWTTASADSCQASGGWAGNRATAGNETVNAVNGNTTFTLSCAGPGGSAAESVLVTVTIPPAPTVSLTAADQAVNPGQATTLAWSSSNATSCTASGSWSGNRNTVGSQSTGPLTGPGSYVLRCDGPGGSASSSVVVEVRPQVSLDSDRTTVTQGESATLSWDASNADGCSASGGWSGAKSASGSESIGPLDASNRFVLTCTGSGGAGSDAVDITVDAPDAPTLSLNTSATVVNEGQSVTLTWSTSNATVCTASGGWTGARSINGSSSVGPLTQNESFGLSCTGPGGSIQSSVSVSLRPTVDLIADATVVTQGQDAVLSWNARHADSCTASGGWSGSLGTSGSQTIGALTADTSFTLTCSGAGGSASDSVAVIVEIPPVPSVVLTAANDVIDPGASTLLTWTSSDASSCTASGAWSGSKSTSDNQSTGSLTNPSTFTLRCDGPGGSATSSVVVNIRPSVQLSADRTSLLQGENVELSWNASNASTCTASGGWSGNFATSGSQTISALTADTGFTLTCSGAGGSASDAVSITVSAPPEPAVSLTVADAVVSAGASTTLAWTSSDSTSCTASGAWSGSKATSGNQSTGALSNPGTFTLRCDGPGGSATSSVVVNVRPSVSLAADRTTVLEGEDVDLSWSTSNANACTASGGWSGGRSTSGSETINALTANTSFTLTCTGVGGSDSESVSVLVNTPDAPTLTLQIADPIVDDGGSTSLTWSTTGATSCTASGSWSGSRPTSGNVSTGPLANPQTYTLDCTGAGGTINAEVSVAIRPTLTLTANPTAVASGGQATLTWNTRNATSCTASGGSVSESVTVSLSVPEPTVSLSAADTIVDSGGSTTLTWTSTDAASCSASGGWSGAKPVSGTEVVGPLSAGTSFSLTCSNASGNAVAMVSVAVSGNLTLSWVAPTENVDGSALTDLAGYRIYWGVASRSYDDFVQLNDATVTAHTEVVPEGDYYVAMTALDDDGNESAYSNEVLKSTQ